MSATNGPPTHADLTAQAIAAANNLPTLVAGLEAINSPLTKQIEGTSVIASRTIWGHMILLAIGALVAKYGVNWNDETQAEVAGGLLLLAQAAWGVIARAITTGPLSGWFGTKGTK